MTTAPKLANGPWIAVAHPGSDCTAILGADRYDDDYASGFATVWNGRKEAVKLMLASHDLVDALLECEAYFESRADAEYIDGTARGNDEMHLLMEVRAALEKAGAM